MKRLAFALVFVATSAHAYCPSYTPAQTAGGQNCGVDPALGSNPSVATWNPIFAEVVLGKSAWGTNGPDVSKIGSGCGKPNPLMQVEARFPCHVLKAIAMQESGWRQFCVPDTPAGSVGAPERTIVSFDCGYGIGQVTSGMHVGETPAYDRGRVAAEPKYNLATGARILAGKWVATQCVGDNNPDLVEDWYTALWAYNGLSYQNNPNNPNLTPGRGPYDPKNGGSYAYQERLYGWMDFPPDAAHWKSLGAAYPNRGDIGTGSGPPALPEPDCASPTGCSNKRTTHTSVCPENVVIPPDAGVVDGGNGSDGGGIGDGGGGADGGMDGGGAGCSCDAGGRGPSGSVVLALLALVALSSRRWRRSI
jgi:MYXO-CTERM domain-containing protein